LAFLRGGMRAWAFLAVIAFARVVSTTHFPAVHVYMHERGAVRLPRSWSGGIWLNKSGSIGTSPIPLLITSTARISYVSSSIPICILRHSPRMDPPCLRAFHAPSPSALMPVLSTNRCNGPIEALYGMATDNVFWPLSADLRCNGRHRVLKSRTDQSRPAYFSWLSTNPVVCLKGRPNKTL
jgi:hypothetical protein